MFCHDLRPACRMAQSFTPILHSPFSIVNYSRPIILPRMTPPPAAGRFFLPGPTEVHPVVLAAQQRPMIAHRGVQMVELLQSLEPGLKALFRTSEPVLIGSAAATGFMEMAVRSGVRHRVLSLVGGAFGRRFAGIARLCGHDVVQLDVPLGQTVEPDMLREALRRTPVDAVTMVHSETSTGALAPLEELAGVVLEFDGVQLLVDAVTSMGGSPVETDEWELDFVLCGAQKALALPPGLAFGVASSRLLEKAESVPNRGVYLDAVSYHSAAKKHQPTNTPSISLLYALQAQLRRIEAEGGIEGRWARHQAMQQAVERWVERRGGEHGIRFLPPPGRRSWTVSCLALPDHLNGRTIASRLAERGWVIGSGYGELKETTIRIGHMGDHTLTELDQLLGALEEVLA